MRWEHWWFTAPLRVRSILRNRRVERELAEELRFHIENKIADGIARGLEAEEARYAAMRAMDGLEQRKEEMRDMRRIHWLTDFLDDAHYATRSLRKTPGFTAFVVATLAIGIGLNSAIFSLVDALVLRPLPVPHPSRVVNLVSTTHDSSTDGFSYREYVDLRDKTKSYEGVAAFQGMQAVGFSAEPGETPRVKGGMMVSGNYFRVLGVEPRLGRGFRDEEDRVPGRDAVVVLGPAFWKQEFAGDPSVLGRHIRLNGTDLTVIGVAPETFTGTGLYERPDFYVPLAMARIFSTDPRRKFFEDRDDRELAVKARLKPGATVAEAQSEIAVLAKNFAAEYPELYRNRGANVVTEFELRAASDESDWKLSLTLSILALAVLLVACTNVAGLLLSRARTRTREIAVRLAIGAGRFRLIRLLMTESLMLALLGGLLGIAIGFAGVRFIGSYKIPTELPVTFSIQMDSRVLVTSIVLTALSALLCGLAPALQSTRANLVNGLKTADVDVPGRKRTWGRNMLVVAQVSASLMLLTTSFLMVRGFRHAWGEGTGFAKDHLLMASFDPRLVRYSDAQTQQFYRGLAERARAIPGVRSAAFTQNIPMGNDNWDGVTFVPDGFRMPRDRENFSATLDTVNEGYFETMDIPILRGRGFTAADTADTPRVAVVNEHFARHYWPSGDAVGKRFRLDTRSGTPVEIVGVAQTIKYQWIAERPMDFVYMPLTQHPVSRMVLMLRSGGPPLELLKPLREAVRELDPNLPMFETRAYEDYYSNRAIEVPNMVMELVTTMGGVGLLLAVAGLYGLIAYNVGRRTREIGIRMAIGAVRSDVLSLVMGHGLVLVAIGTAIGLAMGYAVERLLNSMMFEGAGVDVWAYVIVVPSMFAVTMLAAYVPARRASRIEPTQALRYE
jgi:predicted permease